MTNRVVAWAVVAVGVVGLFLLGLGLRSLWYGRKQMDILAPDVVETRYSMSLLIATDLFSGVPDEPELVTPYCYLIRIHPH